MSPVRHLLPIQTVFPYSFSELQIKHLHRVRFREPHSSDHKVTIKRGCTVTPSGVHTSLLLFLRWTKISGTTDALVSFQFSVYYELKISIFKHYYRIHRLYTSTLTSRHTLHPPPAQCMLDKLHILAVGERIYRFMGSCSMRFKYASSDHNSCKTRGVFLYTYRISLPLLNLCTNVPVA